ncbi:MAG: uroporphyrinogen decarboxylase family protein [Anaerolineae bacterium]
MTTSRERVMRSLAFQTPDRLPKDLGGMRSTGISAFAYPKLVHALNLPPRIPRVEDTYQMLALPDLDVLDALGCDVVTICDGVTNAFEQPELWHPYHMNGRLSVRVRHPRRFHIEPDGAIRQGSSRMVLDSYVFDAPHGGQPLNLDADLPKLDLKRFKRRLHSQELRDEQIQSISRLCRQVRDSSDRAVFLNEGSLNIPISIHGYGGLAIFPILCLLEPDYVAELHSIATEHTLRNIQALLPEINSTVDIIMIAADDWGTQRNTIASPLVYRDLFLPYRRQINDACHGLAPQVKLFLHSCGAIYDILDLVVESGFDIVNPVQWPAGGRTYQEWKEKARGRLALWGGGIDSQHTLVHSSLDEVQAEAKAVAGYLGQDGGFVFCNIHNLLAEVPANKIIAMYRAISSL